MKFQQESETSFEDAIRQGIAEVNATIKHVDGAWVEEQKVLVQEGEIRAFEVIMKVTFVLES